MIIRLRKQPHEQQQKFIDCAAFEQLYGGAKRGGKSVALCMKIIMLSVLYPGNRILLARKDYTDLQDTTLNEFWQVCPPELLDTSYGNGTGHHKGDRCIRLKTINPLISSDILYRGLGGPEDVEKAKGLNLGALAIDEPSELDFETYKMLRAQMTWKLPDGTRPPYMCLLASNPEPGWVKKRFVEEPQPGCVFIPALPRQNPHLPEGWEQELRDSYDAEWVEKYLDGSWEVTEGTVFPELDSRIHAFAPFDHSGLRLVGAIDHATTGITAFVVAGIDANFNMIALDEYYEKDKRIAEHCQGIKSIIQKYTLPEEGKMTARRFDYILIDPSTTQKNQQGANQLQAVADIYRENGINVVPGWNALEAGLQRLKELMHVNPSHSHPLLNRMGAPHLYVVKSQCPNLWREMKDLKKEVMQSGRIRFVGSDHALDCLRYIANSRPKPPELSAADALLKSNEERFAFRSHSRWAAKWAKEGQPSASWF